MDDLLPDGEKMDDLVPDGVVIRVKEEALVDCLKKRMNGQSRRCAKYISEVDVFDHEPWELPGLSKLGMNNDEWYFFYSRQRLYKNGEVWKRKTNEGNWHETGDRKEKVTIATRRIFVFKIKRKTTEWILHEYEIGEGNNMLVGLLKKRTVKNGKRNRAASNGEVRDNLAPNPVDHPLVSEIAQSDYASGSLMNNSVKRNKISYENDYNDNLTSFPEVPVTCLEVHAPQEPPPWHIQTWEGDYSMDIVSCGGSASNCYQRHSCADTMGDANVETHTREKTNQNSAPQQTLLKAPIEQGTSVIDNSNIYFSYHSQNMLQYPMCGTADNETPQGSSGDESSGPFHMPMFSPWHADTNNPLNSFDEFNTNNWPLLVSSDARDQGKLKLGEPIYFANHESCYSETTSKLLNDTHITPSLGNDFDVYSLWVDDLSTTAIGGSSSNSP